MLGGEVGGRAARFVIGDQVDPALAPQLDVLRPVPGDLDKAHGGEDRFEQPALGRGEFDELEPVEAQRIVGRMVVVVGHAQAPGDEGEGCAAWPRLYTRSDGRTASGAYSGVSASSA